MQKILTIPIYQDPTRHIEQFLNSWNTIGSFEQVADLSFKLISDEQKVSTLNMEASQIVLQGDIPSRCLMFVDTLAKACEADKILEGEVVDKNQAQFNDDFQAGNPFANGANSANMNFEMPLGMKSMIKISALSKTKLIILLILALPLLIILLPIIFVIAIIKIIRFKLKF